MKLQINLFQKWTDIDRLSYHFSYNRVNINIIPYGHNTKFQFLKLLKWNITNKMLIDTFDQYDR